MKIFKLTLKKEDQTKTIAIAEESMEKAIQSFHRDYTETYPGFIPVQTTDVTEETLLCFSMDQFASTLLHSEIDYDIQVYLEAIVWNQVKKDLAAYNHKNQ